AERVTPLLSVRPVGHSVILTLLAMRASGQVVDETPPVCACATEGGEVVGVALRTRPWTATCHSGLWPGWRRRCGRWIRTRWPPTP
ncbi:MAG TPA: hypothetical protein VFX70_10615, partial [Mycobacteriales bacterium]|nr:hypothetical protein [Mycobacteriales bacterium]